jgi:hypothetical protein
MTIYMDQTGPLVEYKNGVLHIEDLNPHQLMRWQMTRSEMLRFGWRCLVAAVRR